MASSRIVLWIIVTAALLVLIIEAKKQKQNKPKPKPYCEKDGADCEFLANGKDVLAPCEAIGKKYVCVQAFVKDKGAELNATVTAPLNSDGTPCEERDKDPSGRALEVCKAALTKNNGIYVIILRKYKVTEAIPLPSKSYYCTGTTGKKLVVCPVIATYIESN